jgi:hypothetical protein
LDIKKKIENSDSQSISSISDSGLGSSDFKLAEEMIKLSGGDTHENLKDYNNFHPLSNEIEARNHLKAIKNSLSNDE